MNVESGLICEFVRNGWRIIADSTKHYVSTSYVERLLTCDSGYYHSINAENSYISFYFSKPVHIHSYIISSIDTTHTLFNWDLKFYNKTSNTFDVIDSQKRFDTIDNKKIIQLNNPIITHAVKLIGGLDKDGQHYYMKFHKIEFYGNVIFIVSCKKQTFISSVSYLLVFLLIY